MLIVFGGLPGTGKSTIARALVRMLRAAYLRIDVIEQAIRVARGADGAGANAEGGAGGKAGDEVGEEVGEEGYVIAYGVAGSNLELGQTVVADSVNPLPITREAWRGVAARAGVPLVEVEVVCTDVAEHRRRVESRVAEVAGAGLPTWAAVTARSYAPWPEPHVVIDTAQVSVEEALTILGAAVERAKSAAR